jgi:hypothetical protein
MCVYVYVSENGVWSKLSPFEKAGSDDNPLSFGVPCFQTNPEYLFDLSGWWWFEFMYWRKKLHPE